MSVIDNFELGLQTHIDQLINAEKIREMEEVKKLVQFIEELVQAVESQLLGGFLSEEAAKIKILYLFDLVTHSQMGGNSKIKQQIERLMRIFEETYGCDFNVQKLNNNRKLSPEKVTHCVEIIKDSQKNPMISEHLNDVENPNVPTGVLFHILNKQNVELEKNDQNESKQEHGRSLETFSVSYKGQAPILQTTVSGVY